MLVGNVDRTYSIDYHTDIGAKYLSYKEFWFFR